jgi:hypothetical protein
MLTLDKHNTAAATGSVMVVCLLRERLQIWMARKEQKMTFDLCEPLLWQSYEALLRWIYCVSWSYVILEQS